MLMKCVGIVITFFPNISQLRNNIKTYINDIDTLIVWENTPSENRNYNSEDIKSLSAKIVLLGNGTNVGIGEALNAGVKWLLDNDSDYLLTLDQDSFFEKGMMSKYKKIISDYRDPNIGIFGVNYTGKDKLAYETDAPVIFVKECITSGSMFPKSTFQKGLLFNKELFIDAVDFEFCYRAKKEFGLQTIIITDIILNHKIGYSENNLLGKISDNYSAFRTFYLIKNQIYVWRKFPNLYPKRKKIHLIVKYIALRYLSVLFFENDKKAKLISITKGIKTGLLMK